MKNIKMIHLSALCLSALCSHFNMAQNTSAVNKEDIAYTSPSTTINKRPNITNNGAPGGWGTCILNVLEINSPQSHKLAVASIVIRYTVQAIAHTIQPTILFTLLKFIYSIGFVKTWQI